MEAKLRKLVLLSSKNGNLLKSISGNLMKIYNDKQQDFLLELCNKIVDLIFESVKLIPNERKELLKHVKPIIQHCTVEFKTVLERQLNLLFSSNAVPVSILYLSTLVEEMKISDHISFQVIQHVLPCILQGLDDSDLNELNHYYYVKLLLQILQHYRSWLSNENLNQSEIENLGSLSTRCLGIMLSSKTEFQDLMQMCGTVLGYMLSYFNAPKKVSEALLTLVQSHQECEVEIMPQVFMKIQDLTDNVNQRMIWCVCGVLKCCPPNLMFENRSAQLNVFQFIELLCSSSSKFLYQGFTAFLFWWKSSLQLVKLTISFHELFHEERDAISKSLSVIWKNWDSPISGVPDILVQVFGLILEVNGIVNPASNLPTHICNQLISAPLFVKGKYGLLQVLVSKYGANLILEKYPLFIGTLVPCLSANHLTSVVSKVYKTIVTSLFKSSVLKNEFNVELWEKTIAPSLVKALLHPDTFTRQSALHFWVPVNINLHLDVFVKTVKLLRPNTSFDMRVNEFRLFATIGVIKVARTNGLVAFENLDFDILKLSLESFDDNTRGLAFTVLCGTRKSEMVNAKEFELLSCHIPLNLNSDSSTFRHDFLFSIKQALTRIQCTVIASVKQKTEESNSYTDQCMKFIACLQKLCMSSLKTSSSYQRKRTALSLYDAMIGLFVVQKNCLRKMVIPAEEFQVLLSAMQERNLELFSKMSVECLINLLEDTAPDIREFCLNLLLLDLPKSDTHISWKGVNASFSDLLSSPKSQECESGCLLALLYLENLPSVTKNSSKVDPLSGVISFVEDVLFQNILKQFELFKLDPLKSSQVSPIFGWVYALGKSLEHLSKSGLFMNPDDVRKLTSFCVQSFKTAEYIITWMLVNIFGCVSCEDNLESFASADFHEITNRINKIIESSTSTEQYKKILLSQEHEAILSCTWLTLKHCCGLLASTGSVLTELASKIPECESKKHNTLLNETCDVFVRVLCTCRHRGVVESCYDSFLSLCETLYSSNKSQYVSIPPSVMRSALGIFDVASVKEVSGGTTTRRSAGIPLIAEAVLSSAVKSLPGHKTLLSGTMETLFTVAKMELSTIVTDTTDMPQVHALYILKHLFRNTSLGPSMSEYLSEAFILAINSLKSPVWVIRNAATHLLGAVSCRMLGQKHVEERLNSSTTNSLTITEFFSRFPNLLDFMISILKEGYVHQSQTASNEEPIGHHALSHAYFSQAKVYPIVSVLSKLTSSSDTESDCDEVNKICNALLPLLNSPSFALRKSVVHTLTEIGGILPFAKLAVDYWDSLPCDQCITENQNRMVLKQNELHSWLTLTLVFIQKNATKCATTSSIVELIKERIWLMDLRFNICPLTASLYLEIISSCCEFNLDVTARSAYQASQHAIGVVAENNPVWVQSVGYSMYIEQAVKLSLRISDPANLILTSSLYIQSMNDSRYVEIAKQCIFCWLHSKAKADQTWIETAKSALLSFWCQNGTDCNQTNLQALSLLTTLFQNTTNTMDINEITLFKVKLMDIHQTNKCLSVQCELLKSMSVLLSQLMGSGKYNNLTCLLLNVWVEEVCKQTATFKSSEPLRLASSTGLQIAGKSVIYSLAHKARDCQDLDDVLEKARMVVSATLSHLHDEQTEIRAPACAFVTQITQSSYLTTLQHNSATKMFLDFVTTEFPANLPIVSGLLQTMNHLPIPKISLGGKVDLFMEEAFNVYMEPGQLALLVFPYIKELIQQIQIFPEKWLKPHVETAAFRMQHLVKSMDNLRMKAYLAFMTCTLHYVNTVFHALSFNMYESLHKDVETIRKCCDRLQGEKLAFDDLEVVKSIVMLSSKLNTNL